MRLERVRFLMRFMNDQTTAAGADEPSMVCDYATTQLAGLLGFRVRRSPDLYQPLHDTGRGPVSRLVFRAAVWQAATQALAAKK
jgi:hypothetical protein